jgi:hypothetical protein
MAPRAKLNDAQLLVLRWVADGSPPNVMNGPAHRISAAALRSRGLVRIRGRSSTCRASITDAGRAHLEEQDAPGAERGDRSATPVPATSTTPPKPPRQSAPTIALPVDLRGAHPLVSATRKAATSLRADDDGRIEVGPAAGVAHLVVTRAVLRRALLILHALTREAVHRG